LKSFKEKELEICALTVIAEEDESQEECDRFEEEAIGKVLSEFRDILSEIPGKTEIVKTGIELQEGIGVIS